MNTTEIAKAGIVGGIITIVIELIVGLIGSSGLTYGFSFIAILIGAIAAGWMIKGKQEDAIVAGAISGLIYIVLGTFLIYPALSHYHSGNPIAAIVIGLVLGAIGGFAGKWLCCQSQGASKSSKKK